MKTSLNILILVIIANTMTSCLFGTSSSEQEFDYEYENEMAFNNQDGYEQNYNAQTENGYQQEYTPQTNVSYQEQSRSNGNSANRATNNYNNAGSKTYKLVDPSSGQVMGTMPIPSSWQPSRNSKETYLEGPGGVKIYNDMSNLFHSSNDASFNQIMKQNGNQVKRTMTMEQFFNNEFLPMAQKEGARLIRKTPFPALAQKEKQFDAMFFKGIPEQAQFEAMVTEWIDKDGKPGVVVIKHRITNYGQGRQSWGFTYSGMDADKTTYEHAKAAFLNALQNVQINPQYVQMSNQRARQQSQQMTRNHNSRMAQIRSTGNAQRKLSQTYSEISDINHKGYMERSAMQDAGHAKFINGINEVQTGTVNGTTYQVEGYANNTWVNGNNEYIQSEDYTYDPNIDNNTGDWQKMDYNDDGGW